MKNVVGNWQFSPIYTFQSPEIRDGAERHGLQPERRLGFRPRRVFNPPGVPNTVSTVTPLTNSAGATVAYVANNPDRPVHQAGSGVYGDGRPQHAGYSATSTTGTSRC